MTQAYTHAEANVLFSGSRSYRTVRGIDGVQHLVRTSVLSRSSSNSATLCRSVGCVVIKILEGKPPSHFPDPMLALFRQDDSPPILEGGSPIVMDFLYHCLQKDCNLRVSAKKVLKHPWMVSARKHRGVAPPGEKNAGGRETSSSREDRRKPLTNYNYDNAVLRVLEWNEALKCMPSPCLTTTIS